MDSEQLEVQSEKVQVQSEPLEMGSVDFLGVGDPTPSSDAMSNQVIGVSNDMMLGIISNKVGEIVAQHKAFHEARYEKALGDMRNHVDHLVEQLNNQTLEMVDLQHRTTKLKNAMEDNFNLIVNIVGDVAIKTEVMERKFMSVEVALSVVLSRIERAKSVIIQCIDGLEKEIFDAEFIRPKVDAIKQLNSTFSEIIAKANLYQGFTVLEKVANIETTSPASSIVRWELARVPEPGESMYNSLWDIVNRDWAIPADSKDDLSLGALQMLVYGMQMYVFIVHYLVQQYTVLAQYYYGENDFDKYNQYYLRSLNVFNGFSNTLIGESGFFPKVTSVLRQVKRLHFIRRDRLDVEQFVIKSLENLDRLRFSLRDLSRTLLIVAPDVLDPQLNFTASDIKSIEQATSRKVLPWTRGSKVSYAIQLLGKAGEPNSMVSKWTPGYTLVDKANPIVQVYRDPLKRTRVIFRRFDEGKAQVAAVLNDPDQVEFRDIARDLFDNVLLGNPSVSFPKIKYYLEQGADVNALLNGNQLAIHAAAKREDQWKVAAELIQHGANIDAQDVNGFTPLYIAAKYDNFAFVQNLIEHKANVALASSERNHQLTPLHVATYKGHARIVQLLLTAKSIDLNARSTQGFTALHFAAAFNHESIVTMLLADSRTKIDAKSSLRFVVPPYIRLMNNMAKIASTLATSADVTPLHLAYAYGGEKVVGQLLAKGADIHARTTDGSTVMHYAALNDNAALIPDSAKLDNIVISPNMRDFTPLYIAYQHNNHIIAKKLIDYGAEINVRLSNQRTMLHIAVQCDDANVAQTLLDNSVAVDATDASGNQALHYAVWLRRYKLVDLLLGREANPNAVHHSTGRPLIHSAFYFNKFDAYDMIKKFTQNTKFDVNIADGGSNTLLHFASALGYGKLVGHLLENDQIKVDAPNDNKLTPLHVALKAGHVELAYSLIKKGANVTVYGEGEWRAVNYAIAGRLDGIQTASFVENVFNVTNECAYKYRPNIPIDTHVLLEINMFQASEYNKFEVIEFYAKNCEWLKDAIKTGYTGHNTFKIDFDYICKICGHGYVNILKFLYLLKGPWDVFGYDYTQLFAIYALRGNTNIEVLRYLRTYDYRIRPDINLTKLYPNATNWNALNYTIMGKGDHEVIEFISEKSTIWENHHQIDVEILFPELRGDNGETLMHLVAMSGKIEIAEFLLEKKVDLNAADKDGYTPLHIAARKGDLNMVKFLVENGAHVDETSKEGATPLIEAVWHDGSLDVVQYLHWHEAKIQVSAPWLLVNRAAQLDKAQIAIYLCANLAEKDCIMANGDDETPLHFAAANNNLLLVEYFCKSGIFIDSPTKSLKLTPLYYAIANKGQLEVVKYLHSQKADIKSFEQENLISLAIFKGKYDIARYLIEAGGDLRLPFQFKKSPLHEAVNADQMDLIHLLIQKGADASYPDRHGKTPIDYVFMHKKDTALQYFMFYYLEKRTGLSLMHKRTIANDPDGVELLVQRGRDVNSQDLYKNTPMHLAAEYGYIEVARELLKSKCVNLSTKNSVGETALDIAKVTNHDDIVQLLKHTYTRNRRDIGAEERMSVQSIASSCARPVGLINHAIGSLVSALKSLPGQLSSLVTFGVGKASEHSSTGQSAFQSVQCSDLNGTLLLVDLLIRRHSGVRYVDTSLLSVDPQEARLFALQLVNQLDSALHQLAHQSGEDNVMQLNLFDIYRTVEKLALSGQYERIERLMQSTAREAFSNTKIEHGLIAKWVDSLWTQIRSNKQNSEPNSAAMHFFSDYTLDQAAQKALLADGRVSKQNFI